MEDADNLFVWDDPDKPKLKDRPFNAWRVPRSDSAQRVINDVLNQLQNYEKHLGLRKRKRKAKDQKTFEKTVTAIICDVIHQYLIHGPEQQVFLTQSNRALGTKSRYRAPALNKALPDILKRLASPEMEFILKTTGVKNPFGKSICTTIKAGPRLIGRIDSHKLTLHDLSKTAGAEVIHLKRGKADYWDEGGVIEYEDTADTNLYRQQLLDINSWLESLSIDFDEAVLPGNKPVDTLDRSLRRIFTKERFDHGGRLFGGFWQELGKESRLEGLVLDDDGIVELDYGQMAPRILYGLYDAEPPLGDAYILPGYESYRKGVKKVFNSLLFDEKPRNRMPKGVRKEFAQKHRIQDVIDAIKKAHKDIAEAFGTGIGHRVQFHESQILVDLLLQLKDKGIPALPIHDAVLVPHSMKDEAKQVMLDVFKAHTGVEGLVTEEG